MSRARPDPWGAGAGNFLGLPDYTWTKPKSVFWNARGGRLPSRLPQEALSAHFGEETVKASSSDAERPPVPLWTWLIVAAALAFFFEGTLLRK